MNGTVTLPGPWWAWALYVVVLVLFSGGVSYLVGYLAMRGRR